MTDHDDESIANLQGAEGGQSGDDVEYELVAEEETIDTSWESAEVHPEKEYPRIAYGRGVQHPEPPQRRFYLTDRPPKKSTEVQTESLQELGQKDQGGQGASGTQDENGASGTKDAKGKSTMKRRISERLKQMKFKGSRDESPNKQK